MLESKMTVMRLGREGILLLAFENVCKNFVNYKLSSVKRKCISILTDNIFNLCSNTTFDDSLVGRLLF